VDKATATTVVNIMHSFAHSLGDNADVAAISMV